jgi:hypothetical protein
VVTNQTNNNNNNNNNNPAIQQFGLIWINLVGFGWIWFGFGWIWLDLV